MNNTYVKQKLDELHLIDDFLFFQMMNHPKYGPKFSRLLLKLILGREVGKLHVIPQKEYYGENTDLHGARLDVYLEEEKPDFLLDFEDEGVPSVYDLEPEKKKDQETRDNLPKRVRFYHAVIDSHSLKSGKSYGNLKNVLIIMITDYDPFGLNRMIYTVRTGCVEEPGMNYKDGAQTIFLYTKGTEGNPPEKLRKLLQYIDGSRVEEDLAPEETEALEIAQMVEQIKKDAEVTVKYMKQWEKLQKVYHDGQREGITEGFTKGKNEGRNEGKTEDILELLEDYGDIPEELRKKILSEQDMDMLKKWLKLAAKVSGIEEFAAKM